jgi:hypothetical protein
VLYDDVAADRSNATWIDVAVAAGDEGAVVVAGRRLAAVVAVFRRVDHAIATARGLTVGSACIRQRVVVVDPVVALFAAGHVQLVVAAIGKRTIRITIGRLAGVVVFFRTAQLIREGAVRRTRTSVPA